MTMVHGLIVRNGNNTGNTVALVHGVNDVRTAYMPR